MRKFFKWLAYLCVGAFLMLWVLTTIFSVYFTVRQRPDDFEDPASLAGRPVEAVSIATDDGITLSAWYVKGASDRAVVLLAGIDSNRNSCRSRGEFYLEQGYGVLLPDLRGSGKSREGLVTIGWKERKDLVACYDYLKKQGYAHIGADGISLGAATICYAMPDLPDLSFAIIESSYDTLVNAVRNRLAMYYTPHFIAYPYYVAFSMFSGVPPWRMRPMDYVTRTSSPTLVLAGDSEVEIPMDETQSIYDRCTASIKELHFFKGAGHWNFLGKYPDEYKRVVLAFLDKVFEGDKSTLAAQTVSGTE